MTFASTTNSVAIIDYSVQMIDFGINIRTPTDSDDDDYYYSRSKLWCN